MFGDLALKGTIDKLWDKWQWWVLLLFFTALAPVGIYLQMVLLPEIYNWLENEKGVRPEEAEDEEIAHSEEQAD